MCTLRKSLWALGRQGGWVELYLFHIALETLMIFVYYSWVWPVTVVPHFDTRIAYQGVLPELSRTAIQTMEFYDWNTCSSRLSCIRPFPYSSSCFESFVLGYPKLVAQSFSFFSKHIALPYYICGNRLLTWDILFSTSWSFSSKSIFVFFEFVRLEHIKSFFLITVKIPSCSTLKVPMKHVITFLITLTMRSEKNRYCQIFVFLTYLNRQWNLSSFSTSCKYTWKNASLA